MQNDVLIMQKTIATFILPGQVFEVRALGVQTHYAKTEIWNGFFQYNGNNANEIVDIVNQINPATGIYFTLNPVNASLLGLSFNKMSPSKTGRSTGDKDIIRKRWLPVDIDPIRKSGISATDQMVEMAKETALKIMEYLHSLHFSEPVVALSGNGVHLLYPIDEPCEDGGLIERCLERLAANFNTEGVAVDTSVHNPSRIMRFYGTVARKGDQVPHLQIHHRISKIIQIPKTLDE